MSTKTLTIDSGKILIHGCSSIFYHPKGMVVRMVLDREANGHGG